MYRACFITWTSIAEVPQKWNFERVWGTDLFYKNIPLGKLALLILIIILIL